MSIAPTLCRRCHNVYERGDLDRVGIFGGTFDPIHIGHLVLAEEAWFELELGEVLFVPAGDPPHKRGRYLTPGIHREAMVRLAIADNPHFRLDRTDLDRPGPHYAVDMVRLIRSKLDGDVEIYFLVGLDSLINLPTWHKPEELLEICRFVALSRPGYQLDWEDLETALPGVRERVHLLDMPELEIASHVLQQRVREGRPIRYQVPQAVEKYIREHALYVGSGRMEGR